MIIYDELLAKIKNKRVYVEYKGTIKKLNNWESLHRFIFNDLSSFNNCFGWHYIAIKRNNKNRYTLKLKRINSKSNIKECKQLQVIF